MFLDLDYSVPGRTDSNVEFRQSGNPQIDTSADDREAELQRMRYAGLFVFLVFAAILALLLLLHR